LERALKALAHRSAVPVELDLRVERRPPEHVEVAAYYAVAEALTNAAKYARASVVHVELDAHDATLELAIRDDESEAVPSSRHTTRLDDSGRHRPLARQRNPGCR
jgi:nitrate/nitrite-specific signal transduction histidine kinase